MLKKMFIAVSLLTLASMFAFPSHAFAGSTAGVRFETSEVYARESAIAGVIGNALVYYPYAGDYYQGIYIERQETIRANFPYRYYEQDMVFPYRTEFTLNDLTFITSYATGDLSRTPINDLIPLALDPDNAISSEFLLQNGYRYSFEWSENGNIAQRTFFNTPVNLETITAFRLIFEAEQGASLIADRNSGAIFGALIFDAEVNLAGCTEEQLAGTTHLTRLMIRYSNETFDRWFPGPYVYLAMPEIAGEIRYYEDEQDSNWEDALPLSECQVELVCKKTGNVIARSFTNEEGEYLFKNTGDPSDPASFIVEETGESLFVRVAQDVESAHFMNKEGSWEESDEMPIGSIRDIDRITDPRAEISGLSFTWKDDSIDENAKHAIGGKFLLNIVPEQIVPCKVVYDANGGIGMVEDPLSPYNQGDTVVLLENQFIREGHDFDGWSLSAQGEVIFQPGDEYEINGDTTFYAVWVEEDVPSIPPDPSEPPNPPDPPGPPDPPEPEDPLPPEPEPDEGDEPKIIVEKRTVIHRYLAKTQDYYGLAASTLILVCIVSFSCLLHSRRQKRK